MSAAAFDRLIIALSALLVGGGHLLVWAGLNGFIDSSELFSPWALPLYAGFVTAAYLLLLWWTDRRGRNVRSRNPAYRLAIYGSALFIVAIVGELAWRSLGERLPAGPEGVIAPTRLAMFVGAALILSGPIASIAGRLGDLGRRAARVESWTLAVAIGLLLSVVTLLTGFVHPFFVVAGGQDDGPAVQPATDLYLVPLDGRGSQRLTTTPDLYEVHPDAAPDGSRVAFARGPLDDFRIFTMAASGGDERRLTTGISHEDGPVWAPVGARLAYWAELPAAAQPTPTPVGPVPAPRPTGGSGGSDQSGLAIWTIDGDGRNAVPLRDTAGEGAESWSTRDQLCGWSVAGNSFDVAIWEVASGAKTDIATGPSDEWGCAWSLDGSRVAFHSDRDGDWEIYSAASDGTDLRQLTDDPGIDQLPRWSPDGTQLAFISSRSGQVEIFVASGDGSNARNVTNDPALDDGIYGIAWMPDGSALVAASWGRPYNSPLAEQTVPLGVASIVLQSLILAGALLFAARLTAGAPGVATVVGLVNGLLAALMGAEPLFFLAPLASGLAVELVAARWRGSIDQSVAGSALVAATAAAGFSVAWFVVLAATRGVGWGADLMVGTIALSVLLAGGAAVLATWPGRAAPAATIG